MSKSIFNEMLDREVQRRAKQTPSVEEAVAMLVGRKDKRSIPKSKPKYTEAQRAERMAKIKAIRDSKKPEAIDTIEDIPEIDHIAKIPEIPTGFPEGTILNDDGTLSLPDGRTIRKKQEADHEEVS